MASIDKQYRIKIPTELLQNSKFQQYIKDGIRMKIMGYANHLEVFPDLPKNEAREFCSVVTIDSKGRFNIPTQIMNFFHLEVGMPILVSVQQTDNIIVVSWKYE